MKSSYKINIAAILFIAIISRLSIGLAFAFAGVLLVGGAIWSMQGHAQRVRNWRIRRGVCANCEYDLRQITSDRCPECGQPIQRSIAQPATQPINYGPEGSDL